MRGEDLVNVFAVELGKPVPVSAPAPNVHPLRRYDQQLLSGITPRIDGDGFSAGVASERGLLDYFLVSDAVTLYDQPQIHILPDSRRCCHRFPIAETGRLTGRLEISEHDGSITHHRSGTLSRTDRNVCDHNYAKG